VKTRIWNSLEFLSAAPGTISHFIYSDLKNCAERRETEFEMHYCSTFSSWAMERLSKC
jgi:hypothetical protein